MENKLGQVENKLRQVDFKSWIGRKLNFQRRQRFLPIAKCSLELRIFQGKTAENAQIVVSGVVLVTLNAGGN